MKFILSRIPTLKISVYLLLSSSILQAQNSPNSGSTYPVGTVTAVLPSNYTAGVKVNYIRSITLKEPITAEASIQITDPNQTKVTTEYIDGLGRPIQSVDHFASPNQNDIVNLIAYDNFGRDAWHFLPYSKVEAVVADHGNFKLTAFSDQKSFYKATLGYTVDNYFYTQTNYEPSPLNRVSQKLPQGSSWVGNNRGTTVTENPSSSDFISYTIAYTAGSLPVLSGSYKAGE